MRKLTKFRRSINAISPIIATLLLIAIAVVASLVAYAWIMGYLGFQTNKSGQSIQIQSFAVSADGTTLTVYVQNIGQGAVSFDPTTSAYINTVGKAATISPTTPLGGGDTATFTIAGLSLDTTKPVDIKIVTSGGTYMEATGVAPIGSGGGTGGNHAPVATADSYSTPVSTALNVVAPGVLANDNDQDANTLTATKVADPLHGTVTLAATGSFTYTPVTGYTGSDSFTYKANDGSADSNTVTVSITVSNTNQAPVATADSYSTNLNTPLNVPTATGVLANDNDPDANTITAVQVSGPSHQSTFTLNSDGSFAYTPASDYTGSDSFTYHAYDSSLYSNTVTVTITVNSGNQPHYVDSRTAVVGSEDNWANMHDTSTGTYDTITEANTAGAQSWISPTGYTSSDWSSEGNAYDGNTGTSTSYDINENTWSPYLILTYPSTTGTSFNYYVGRESSDVNNMHIDVYNTATSSWQNVYSGAPTINSMTPVTFTSRTTNAVRIQLYNDNNDHNRLGYVYETQVLSVPSANYQLDYQAQFTGISSGYTHLEIKTGNLGTENLQVYYRATASDSWTALSPLSLTANQINTYANPVSGATLQLRFVDGTPTSDTTQSTWQIDYIRLIP